MKPIGISTAKRLGLASVLFAAGCASTPVSPLQKDAALSADKGKVFDTALLTLQEWGEDILTVDKAGGILATRPRESGALRYRLTIFVKESEGSGSLVEVNAHGEKHTPEQDDWWTVDENDHELRSVIEGILAGIVQKVGG